MRLATAGDFLIIDLEATCWEEGNYKEGRLTSEIIEIGGCYFRPEQGVILEFSIIVKPTMNPTLSPFCTKLTSITQEMVDGGVTFPQAVNQIPFIGQPIFTSWGDYDRTLLAEECRRYHIRFPFASHLNLKRLFAQRHGNNKPMGEDEALKKIGLQFEGTRHRGVDDAKNSARILAWMIEQEKQPGKF